MSSNPSKIRVPTTGKFSLSSVDPSDRCGLRDRAAAEKELAAIHARLKELQIILHAEAKRSILVVLQAMDAGGKDGTIRNVFGPLNPHWVHVTDFRAPTAAELARDYLWRVHNAVPPRGTIGIFNRSHYEDVLVVRVHRLAPKAAIARRYEQINAFEKHLAENGTTILKFHLHISKREQKKRLQARLDHPTKHWKFNPNDVRERKHWPLYMESYEKALRKCSTPHAPWYCIPANRKWARNLHIARTVLSTLESLSLQYPKPDLDGVTV